MTVLKLDESTRAAAEDVYSHLLREGIDALIDDRDERPGVKFNDAELIGIPYRITVGPRGLDEGIVEVTNRASGETEKLPLGAAAAGVADRIRSERT